eukprot:1144916-Pelagomonas_calceolata.AAC.13
MGDMRLQLGVPRTPSKSMPKLTLHPQDKRVRHACSSNAHISGVASASCILPAAPMHTSVV